MSRYYNEEWQRKKAYLIRSLFHDIPYSVLSPVREESYESSQAQNTKESSPSSNSNHIEESYSSSHEYSRESESVASSDSPDSDSIRADTGRIIPEPRPFSPLPPLIIEVEPNKHDEQEEYYIKLMSKMRKIYRKMFVEGKFLTDEQFFETDIERSSDRNGFHEEPSFNVDLESTRNENVLKDITNLDERKDSVEDKSGMSVDLRSGEDSDGDIEEMELESCTSTGEPAYSQMTFKADIHIDGTPVPPVRPSPIYEEPRIEILSASVKNLSYDTQILLPETLPRDSSLNPKSSLLEATSQTLLLYEDSPNGTRPSQGEGQPFEIDRTPVHKAAQEELVSSQVDSSKIQRIAETLVSGQQLEVALNLQNEEEVRSPILTCGRKYRRLRKCHTKAAHQTSFGEYICTQSTPEATVDTEVSRSDMVSKSKEDNALVLPFRKTIEERSLCVERNLTILEENEDPDSTTSSAADGHMQELEVMRTPRPDELRESIPTSANRVSSNGDGNCDQNMIVPNISDVIPVTEDDERVSIIQQTHPTDIDDVLSLLFNTTPEFRPSAISEETLSSQRGYRKRRFEERSAQTMDVSWSDLRDNFFVGTPKILKLCSCVGHNCS